jgi:polyisoprenoid-binding protein YceI
MKKLLLLIAGLLLYTFPANSLANTSTWIVDYDHTSVTFGVKHMGLSVVRGIVPDVKGTITLSDDKNHSVQLDLKFDANSLLTGIKKRDDHLKSADFLDVAKHPVLTFRSTGTTTASDGKINITGDLTIQGITKEVTLLFTGPTKEVTDPWGNRRIGAKVAGVLRTADFGLNWNKPMPTGGMVIGEHIEVTMDLEVAIPKKK